MLIAKFGRSKGLKPTFFSFQERSRKNSSNNKNTQDVFRALRDSMGNGKLPEKDATNPLLEFVNTYGLGAEEGSSEWRDKKLEMKIAGLFKQTVDLAQMPGAELHPKDVIIREKAVEARARLADRLHDLRMKDPERFSIIYQLIYSNFQGRVEEEKKALSDGKAPGTLTPPWVGGDLVWKSFFDDHLSDFVSKTLEGEGAEEVVYEDGTTYHDNKLEVENNTNVNEKYPWLPAYDPNEKLEQLEDPAAWDDKSKKKKKTCIFCSPERDQFPLEPMNVNLLLRFMNPSGFIKPRSKTGLCRTMQQRVARTIKHARTLGLFSYKKGVFTIRDPTGDVRMEYENRLQKEKDDNEDEEDRLGYEEGRNAYDQE